MKLEIGSNHSFEIRKESCIANCEDDFTVLFLSDLHFNKNCKTISENIAATINELNPTIVLLGGDYVDSEKGMAYFNNLLIAISDRENVFAIAGNHDYFYGINKIEKVISNNNIAWLENGSTIINYRNTTIKIDGSTIGKENNSVDCSILLMHKPLDLNQFEKNYNLAFAGHLHGCQFVIWKSKNKLYPGRLFYKWNILKAENSDCQYFISKGLGDTLPIRYNCKRDLVLVQVSGKTKQDTEL